MKINKKIEKLSSKIEKALKKIYDLTQAEELAQQLISSILEKKTDSIAKLIIEQGANPFMLVEHEGKDISAWEVACNQPDLDVFRSMVIAIRETDWEIMFQEIGDDNGFTPLMYVAKSQDYAKTSLFVWSCLDFTLNSIFACNPASKKEKFTPEWLTDIQKTFKQLLVWGANPERALAYYPSNMSIIEMTELVIKQPDASKKIPFLESCVLDMRACVLANNIIKNNPLKKGALAISTEQQELITRRLEFYFSQNPKKLSGIGIDQYAEILPQNLADKLKALKVSTKQQDVNDDLVAATTLGVTTHDEVSDNQTLIGDDEIAH